MIETDTPPKVLMKIYGTNLTLPDLFNQNHHQKKGTKNG